MSEQSPFDLYGKMLTAYVDACVEVNRAWFANATRLGAGFFTPFPPLRPTQPNRSTGAAAPDIPGFPNTNGTSAGSTQAAVAPRAEAVTQPTRSSEPHPVTEDGASDIYVESGAVAEQRDLVAEVRPSDHGRSVGDLVINDVSEMSSSHTGLGAISTTRIDPDVLGAVNDVLQPHMENAALPSDTPQGPTRAKTPPKRSRKPKSR